MGKRKTRRKSVALSDSDDDRSVSSSSTLRSDLMSVSGTEEVPLDKDSLLDQALEALFEKRGSTREKALSSIVEAFNSNLQHQFVEKNFVTLLRQCLNSFKRGSAQEISSASHVIGLLALTVGFGDKAHEILEESFSAISQALKFPSELSKVSSLLVCLAIITFIGGKGPEEMERSMQIMWKLVHPKLGSNVVASEPSTALITAVVSSWSFLLTAMDGWRLDTKNWQESISYFSSLLDKKDRSVRIAAGEALALIFEMGSLENLSVEAKVSSDGSQEGFTHIHIQGLKGKILNQVRNLCAEAGGKGSAKKDLNNQRNLFRDILEFIEDGYSPESSVKIGGDSLSTSTWSQLIQLKFLKHFLGGGFVKHMLENEFIQEVLGFEPKRKQFSGSERHISRSEKRLYKSPNSVLNKARTQQLNKDRMLSQAHGAFFQFDRDEVAAESSSRVGKMPFVRDAYHGRGKDNDNEELIGFLPKNEHIISMDPIDNIARSEMHGKKFKAFWTWLFVISNLSFEILASAFDQVSSPNKPRYALAGLVMSLVAVAVCVTEFLWKARKEKVTMRRWGPIWWFYYQSPRGRLYGTFAEIFGLNCAILQVLFSGIQYYFFHQHADNPIKISIFPIIFALCVSGSKLINNPNERPLKGHSVVDHREMELEEIAIQRYGGPLSSGS